MTKKMPCFGYLDEDDNECQSFCSYQKDCSEERYKNLLNLAKMLQTQKNTVDRSQPILNHFEKDFFSKVAPEMKTVITEALMTLLDREDQGHKIEPSIIFRKNFIKHDPMGS